MSRKNAKQGAALDAATLRQKILAAEDLPRELVRCPEWGVDVYVRTLTAAERNRMEVPLMMQLQKLPPAPHDNGARARSIQSAYIAACCVDAEGRPLFTLEDAEALDGKNGTAVNRILQAADRINRLSAGAVESIQGN